MYHGLMVLNLKQNSPLIGEFVSNAYRYYIRPCPCNPLPIPSIGLA